MSERELEQQLMEAQKTIRTFLEELREANQGVIALTLELEQRNETLENEVAERKRVEEELRRMSISRVWVGEMLRDFQTVGSLTEGAMYRAGQELAVRVGGETLAEFLEAFAGMGLGTLVLTEADEELRRWSFTADELVESRAESGEPTGHYTRGFLCGAVSCILGGVRATSVELACQSMGDALCRFAIQAVREDE